MNEKGSLKFEIYISINWKLTEAEKQHKKEELIPFAFFKKNYFASSLGKIKYPNGTWKAEKHAYF